MAQLAEPGKTYSDSIKGTGLYLLVTKAGTRRWLFIYSRNGKRREMGLGLVDGPKAVSLKRARDQARAYQQMLASGADPWTESRLAKEREAKVQTFGDFADAYIAEQARGFRNAKHIAQWKMTMKVYAKRLRPLPIDKIKTDDVLAVLKPIWLTRPETAKRTQGRIERIMDAAKAQGLRTGENPARWRGHLDMLLARQSSLSRGHHAALPYPDLPKFMATLRAADGMSARALEFLILTAARTGEVIGASWDEIDLKNALWTVPPARMKAGREHRVPLSPRALEVLNEVSPSRGLPGAFVFPGGREGEGLSQMAMTMALRRCGKGEYTVHGFRSAFREWAAEETNTPREVAEAALAHVVGDKTEQAYRRGDALQKRRDLMDAWAIFCTPDASDPAGATSSLVSQTAKNQRGVCSK
ncbi:tyrosine-type recombinase/integrase [Pseudaminobacter sp. NGMCC 1.201702]|uniref:tyrosine-type recombinase/integrase n=1 Tax=Pseudaminobacter sp. NGMCC 1.201702 TaxID=3391825 RepID=UPI0039F0E889